MEKTENISFKERKFDYLNATLWLPDDAPSPIDMSLKGHPIHKEHTFSRKFRFTLDSTGEPNIRFWCSRLDIDFIKKTLMLSFYDRADIRRWVDNLKEDEVLTLTVVDGIGEALWIAKFTGLEVHEQKVSFDYSSSAEVKHNVLVTFTEHNRKDYYPKS